MSKFNSIKWLVNEMLSVKNLIDGKVDFLNDKLFWYANKVLFSDTAIEIYTSNQALIAFDDCCSKLNAKCISDLAKQSKVNDGLITDVLVSTGSFLFLNNKLIATKRTSTTKFDPNCWTSPAGRCDRTPLVTAIKETIEEIKICDEKGNVLMPSITQNLLQSDNYKFYNSSHFSKNIHLKQYKILFFIDQELIETSQMWAYFSQEVNTLELRLPIFFESDENLIFTNPEFFTDTKILDLESTAECELVPALRQLKKEIYNGNR